MNNMGLHEPVVGHDEEKLQLGNNPFYLGIMDHWFGDGTYPAVLLILCSSFDSVLRLPPVTLADSD